MTNQKELYSLANVEAPSGVPPESSTSFSSQLESTAADHSRQPRNIVNLSVISEIPEPNHESDAGIFDDSGTCD